MSAETPSSSCCCRCNFLDTKGTDTLDGLLDSLEPEMQSSASHRPQVTRGCHGQHCVGLYTVAGCDTTSSSSGHGRRTCWKLLEREGALPSPWDRPWRNIQYMLRLRSISSGSLIVPINQVLRRTELDWLLTGDEGLWKLPARWMLHCSITSEGGSLAAG